MTDQSHVRTSVSACRFPRNLGFGCAFLVNFAIRPLAAQEQLPPPYYPPVAAAAQAQAAPSYQNPGENYPVRAYGGDSSASGDAGSMFAPQFGYRWAVPASYTESNDDNRSAVYPATQVTFRDPPAVSPQTAEYSTEVIRPQQAGEYASSPAGNPYRVAQNAVGPEIIRPATPAISGEPPPIPQPPQATENRFEGLLPAAGPPPALGPVPTPQVEREFARFVNGAIVPENSIKVVAGRAVVMVTNVKPRRIYIPNEDFATCQVVTDQQIAIVGKKEGRTVLNLWFPDPRAPNDPAHDRALSYLIVVLRDTARDDLARWEERRRTEAEVDAYQKALKVLQGQIKETFPESAVQLSMIGEQVVVRGEAKDVVEAAQILSIIAEHAPVSNRRRGIGSNSGGGRNPNVNVNMGLGTGTEGAAVNALQSLSPGVNLSLNAGPGQERAALNAIQQILSGAPNVVNLLRIPGEQQVMLMVTVAEVNRTAARTIGMDFSIVHGGFAFAQNTSGGLNVGNAAGTAAGNAGSAIQSLQNVGGNLPTAIDNGNVLMAIQALRTMDFARSLAEPNLTTLNGRPANFQAGGSFPIPTSVVTPGGAAQSVTYQNFGVALEFTPYITDRDRIRLQLNASVSTPSVATTQVSGAQVPSQITQRQFNTTVEMREGQTLTVAGLIQNNFSGTSKRVPLWGDLPIIGRTGGNDSVTSGEQELVVLVTPVLVHPLEMCKTPPLPGNNIFEPGNVEFYLLGHLEGRRSEDFRTSVRTDFDRQTKWCQCDDVYIIGPHGPSYGCCRSCPCPNANPSPQSAPPANGAMLPMAPPGPPEPLPSPTPQ